ncbi:MAG: type II toxin-antitoxin system Phd/YefM family antitoxin [Bryobacteraceae bacterium]
MKHVNIQEAKTHLSQYLKRVKGGEIIILCNRNVPVAEIRPLRKQRTTARPLGLAKGQFNVPPEFFDPLPPELLKAFNAGQA